MADLIAFRRVYTLNADVPLPSQIIATRIGEIAERMEPCRATSEYLNRPCRAPAELEAMLRARADVTAAREGV